MERLAGYRQSIIKEAKMNIKQAQEEQEVMIANMPTQMCSRLALKSYRSKLMES